MINIDVISDKLIQFLNSEISNIAGNHPAIAFFRPLISRILNNNVDKITNVIKLIADENGNVDIIPLLNDMTKSLMETRPFVIDTGILGDVEIGNGQIKLKVPMIDKTISLTMQDINKFRQMLTM